MISVIRLTGKCNQNCMFCHIPFLNPKTLDIGYIKQKIDKLNFLSASKTFELTGGEPTILNDLPEIIKYIKLKNTENHVRLQTNAMMFAYTDYTAKLKEAGLDEALVSLHSHEKAISDSLTRTKGGFQKTMIGINNLLKKNIKVGISFVINRRNHNQILDFIKDILAKQRDISYFLIALMFEEPNYLKHPENCVRYLDFQRELKKALFFLNSKKKGFFTCGIPFCLLQPYEKSYYVGQLLPDRSFVKNSSCFSCNYNDLCPGIPSEYAELFGTSEVIPVTTDVGYIKKRMIAQREEFYIINNDVSDKDKYYKLSQNGYLEIIPDG